MNPEKVLPQCEGEIEFHGGPHSWFERCGLPVGHRGVCEVLDLEGKVRVGTRGRNEHLRFQIDCKQREMAVHTKAIRKLEAEIGQLQCVLDAGGECGGV